MAAITQRESGLWEARIRRRGQPTQSKTFTNKRDAEAWGRHAESQIERGAFVSTSRAERTTLMALAQRFADEFAPGHYRSSAWQIKLQHLVQRLGVYSIAALTPERLAGYRDQRLADPDPRYKEPGTAPRVSGATVKTELDLLSKVLGWAEKEGGVPLPLGNPVDRISKPKPGASRERRLTGAEAEALERACARSLNRWLLPAYQFAVATAMRQGELLGLTWNRVNMATRVAWLPKTKNGEPRAVPLSSAAVAVLQALPRSIDEKVFPVEKQTLATVFRTACRRAGIENFRWHDLRHEALSRLAERGDLSVLELSAISGHKTLRMMQLYVKMHAEKLAQKLG